MKFILSRLRQQFNLDVKRKVQELITDPIAFDQYKQHIGKLRH